MTTKKTEIEEDEDENENESGFSRFGLGEAFYLELLEDAEEEIEEIEVELEQLQYEKALREYDDASVGIETRRKNLQREIEAAGKDKTQRAFAATGISYTIVDLVEAIVRRGEIPRRSFFRDDLSSDRYTALPGYSA